MARMIIDISFICLILHSFILSINSDFGNLKLQLVQAIWRHGSRTPLQTYPTDPYQEKHWKMGWGELTPLGMEQEFNLGQLLRKRYVAGSNRFLSEIYSPKEIYVQSTDRNRTLISAMATMAGLYSCGGESGEDFPDTRRWPYHWTPIPVHTVNRSTDHIVYVGADCPRADQIRDEYLASEKYKQILVENHEFLDFLANKTNDPADVYNLIDIYNIQDAYYIENVVHELKQPNWFTPTVYEKVLNLTTIGNAYYMGIPQGNYSNEMIRLIGGSMIKELVNRMTHKLDCLSAVKRNDSSCAWINSLKAYFYSAHDDTIAGCISTFVEKVESLIPGIYPGYSSSLLFELYSDDEGQNPQIKILFRRGFNLPDDHNSYEQITNLAVGCPNKAKFCPFNVFKQHRQKYFPNNIEQECQKH